jgi:hypothetical protein
MRRARFLPTPLLWFVAFRTCGNHFTTATYINKVNHGAVAPHAFSAGKINLFLQRILDQLHIVNDGNPNAKGGSRSGSWRLTVEVESVILSSILS